MLHMPAGGLVCMRVVPCCFLHYAALAILIWFVITAACLQGATSPLTTEWL